jgi:hypothetical protein
MTTDEKIASANAIKNDYYCCYLYIPSKNLKSSDENSIVIKKDLVVDDDSVDLGV